MNKNFTSELFRAAKKLAVLFCAAIALCMMSISSYGQTVVVTFPPTVGPWIVPAGVTSLTVYCWGGGGAGGSSNGTGANNGSGAGGGGGGAVSMEVLTVAAGQSYTVTVGAGGTPGGAGNNAGGTGGTTTFTGPGGSCVAVGGGGGGGAKINNIGIAGTAGGPAGCTGYIYSGGAGVAGGENGTDEYGGGGGGGGGNAGNGANATAGKLTAPIAGSAGGAGGIGSPNAAPYVGGLGASQTCNASQAVGAAGTAPGGGGSGGYSFASPENGGAGGQGQVVIVYTTSPTITNMSPNPACVGNTLTVTGSNYTASGTITFTGVGTPVPYTYVNSSTVTATIPAGTTTGPITVTTSSASVTSGSNLVIGAYVTPSTPIPATGYVAAGASTVTVYGFTLTPNSCASGYSFLSVQIGNAGTATTSDLSNFRLYYDVNANGVYDMGTDILASSAPLSLANPLSFSVTGQTGITTARNYIVVADVANNAVPGHTFTAGISNASGISFAGATQSGTIGGFTQTIEGSVAIAANQPAAAFLTDGSASNPIAGYAVTVNSGFSYTPSSFTFTTAGTYTATTDFTTFRLWQSASSTFSAGTSTPLQSIAASGNPQTLLFNALVGATPITLSTTSYFYITTNVGAAGINGDFVNIATDPLSNFVFNAATVASGTNPTTVGNPQTIKTPVVTITTQATPAAGTLSQGTNNNPIAAYLVNVANYSVTPTSFAFTTTGGYSNVTDITSLSLYSNSTNSILGATLIQSIAAPASGGTVTFNSGFTPLAIGNIYFIITANVGSCAVNSDAISITMGTANFANFTFTSASGTVTETGPVNPAAAGNTQTIAAPFVTVAAYTYAAGNVSQSTTSNILAIYTITAGSVAVTPSSFVFTTAGSYTATTDFTNFQLYVNDNPNTASPFQTLTDATATPGPGGTITFNSFTGSSTIPANTTRYFVVTADVPSTGINGDYASIAAEPVGNLTFVGCVSTSPASGSLAAGANQTIYGPTVAITTESMPIAANITVGTNSNIIAVYTLNTSNATSVTPAGLTLTTITPGYAAADFSNFHLYENTNATLSGSPTLVQTVASVGPGTNLVFGGGGFTPSPIASGVTTYLIVTADVAAGATLGDYIDFTTTSFANFTFTSSAGTVQETGVNPAAVSNKQTIVGPAVAITAVSPIAGSMLVGSTNNLLAAYKLAVTNGAVTPTSVTLVTSTGTYAGSSDITNFYLWQNTSNSLSGATLVGTIAATAGSPQTLVFNASTFGTGYALITSGTTSYLLLSADVAGGAVPGDYIYINSTTATGSFSFNTTATVTGGTLAAGNNQTIVSLLDVYWTGTNNWNTVNTNTDWWQSNAYTIPNLWVVDGRAHLGGTAGTITLNSGTVTAAQIFDSTVNPYYLTSSGAGDAVTLSTPSNIYVGAGIMYAGTTATVASANSVFGGINGLTLNGTGTLDVGSPFVSTFSGGIYVNNSSFILGTEGFNNSNPEAFLPTTGNNIILNNGNLTIAAAYGNDIATAGPPEGFPQGPGCLENLTSVISTGNSSITLYKTRATQTTLGYTTKYPYMGIAPTTDNFTGNIGYFGIYGTSISDLTPLKISGTLTVNGGGSLTGTQGADINNFRYVNYISFGGVSLTGNTTFQAYASSGAFVPVSGTLIDIDLGGIGSYLTGVTAQSSQPINDSGFTMTFLGNGSSIGDGGELSLNAASSTMTGKWVIGDAAGTNAAWVLTNTGTCLSLGTATVYNYSKLAPKITTASTYTNVTYAPSTIYLYGIGPANVSGGTTAYYPGALDFFNFGTEYGTVGSTYTTALSSNIVLNQVPQTHLAGIAIANAAPPASFPGTCNLQINGTVTGTGGLAKYGWGTLTLNAQNISGNYNSYTDSTEIYGGIITVNYGSNLGAGPLVFDQVVDQISGAGGSPIVNLNNTSQTISSLSSYFTSATGTFVQTVNINGCTLTDSQSVVNTIYGSTGAKATMTSIIAGTGTFIKTGTATLTLTSANTYTGLTQVKGGTLALSRTAGTTLPITNTVDILGGTLSITTAQTLKNVTLSTGTLNIASGITLTITGTFTLVNGTITGGGTIAYSNGTLIYAGSSAQTVNSGTILEWPTTNAPLNVAFDNNTYTGYTTGGVKLPAAEAIVSGGTATVNGWLDFSGKALTGAGGFILNGLTSKAYTGKVTMGSPYITNMSSNNGIYPGMLVTGAGIPSNTYIIYIDTVLQSKSGTSTLYLNNNAGASGTTVALTITARGGVKVSLPTGLDNSGTGHVQVTGTKTYNPGANYVFNTPTTGAQIYPGFPTTPASLTYSPAWDVKINVGSGNNMSMPASGVGSSIEVADSLVLSTGVWATNTGLITWDNPGTSYLVEPQPTWAANNTAYINSFIATCDNTGNPISVSGPTSAYTGNQGFKIKSVTNVNTYFPVGASFISAYPTYSALPSPNRMMVNNAFGTPEDFSVVVNYGRCGFYVRYKWGLQSKQNMVYKDQRITRHRASHRSIVLYQER